jgi:hypothetical protein
VWSAQRIRTAVNPGFLDQSPSYLTYIFFSLIPMNLFSITKEDDCFVAMYVVYVGSWKKRYDVCVRLVRSLAVARDRSVRCMPCRCHRWSACHYCQIQYATNCIYI